MRGQLSPAARHPLQRRLHMALGPNLMHPPRAY